MKKILRVLQVEDSERDAALIVRLLEKANYECLCRRVETAEEMREALEREEWDAVIADYSLPLFNAPAALAMMKQKKVEIPFIVVSGAIGEETAVAIMKEGASDYLLKDNLSRLVPALEREIRESRRKRRDEWERENTIALLHWLTVKTDLHELLDSVVGFLQEVSRCEAVGIRLRDGDRFPYFVSRGFEPRFLCGANDSCARCPSENHSGKEPDRQPLFCMCGNVLGGRIDPEKPYFTEKGSFWTHSTTGFLKEFREPDGTYRFCHLCHDEGYRSVALIPLRIGGEVLGLMQLNDRREERFTREFIDFIERMGETIGIAVAHRQSQQKIALSLKEKEVLLRELYHRTKNNMQVICSMLDLQSSVTENELVSETYQVMKDRIVAMSLVHQKLYQSGNLSEVDLGEYLRDLAGRLLENYQVVGRDISLATNLEKISVNIDAAIPCGLIVNELISNSLKHAFPGTRGGQIRIRLSGKREKEIDLEVADNGVGVAESFDPRKVQTLGLELVLGIGERQLGGRVTFGRSNGFSCAVRFPGNVYGSRVMAKSV